ncbi:MAG: helix-turn-helix transcriptional regulator [Xanthobacteraceae bacterium]
MFATLNAISRKLLDKLQKKSYRAAYVGEHVRQGIAYQIRALRDQRGWKQGELAQRMGKPQSVVSRLEDPNYGKVTVQTLLEAASVFDVALQVRFVPFSSFLRNTRNISANALEVLSFADDISAKTEPIVVPRSEASSFLTYNMAQDEHNMMRDEQITTLITSKPNITTYIQ